MTNQVPQPNQDPAPKKHAGGRPRIERTFLPLDVASDLQALLTEKAKRRIEALKLYRPLPLQQQFHNCKAKEKLARGANRSGKTLTTCAELAMIVTGQDPTNRLPKEDGTCYIVGKDGKELGEVLYAKLFRAGAFKIIRDEATNDWRAYMPLDPGDAARAKQAKPAPPLIPPRWVKSIAWENKKMNVPALIVLTNGWRLHFFSSNAEPTRGSAIHLALFDEEVLNTRWYPEIAARLLDHSGYFLWGATPQAGTEQLFELHKRAEEQARWPKEQRSIEEFHFLLDDNVHQTDAQKQEFAAKLSPEELAVRVMGEFSFKSFRVFPEFGDKHMVPYFEIPANWTVYVGIDPGRQVCAGLFLAIPPPEEGDDHAYLYDEIYVKNCSAEIFAQAMRHKCVGRAIEAFIIDRMESRKYETGSGKTIEEQYSDALKRHNVSCERTGPYFTPGAADPLAGVEAIRGWLRPRDGLPPKLRVLSDKVPNFLWEIDRYIYKRDGKGIILDVPRDRGPVHTLACLRYLVQDEPVWVEPKKLKPRASAVVLMARELMKGDGKTGDVLNLGPGKFLGA